MTDSPVAPVRLRAEIAALPPYRQGKRADGAAHKLSSNENPHDPLPGVLEAIAAASQINRYPDATARRLRELLAARYGVGSDRVHIAAGSVAILAQLISAAAGPGDEVVYAWRSFEAYPTLVTVAGATSVQVPLTADGRHDLAAMVAAVTDRTRCIIVCSPNNPTGPTVRRDEFAAFLDALPNDLLVLLDEAYAEFVTDPEAVNGLGPAGYLDRPQVVTLRTFSKAYGLAGLRIGYAVGDAGILAAAHSAAIPLSVTAHAEAAALASLDAAAEDVLHERVAVLVERRDRLADALRTAGWRIPVAQGNFVWLATGTHTSEVAGAFEDAGLIVRPFLGEGVRISVGEEESVEKVLRVAESVVQNLPEGHPARTLA